jgi:uncharacterized membrane protein (Fun14 family)
MSIIKSFVPSAATMGCGFIVGILIGYALKKVIKIATVIIGLFLAGLAYLQYHLSSNGDSSHAAASSLAMTSFGIPLTGSMSAGFTLGFIKG